jgi:hypothetical protein
VVIDDAGLIVTIGYLITEAMGAEITTADGKVSRADVVGVDLVSGLGLLPAAEALPVKPCRSGRRKGSHRRRQLSWPAPAGSRRRSRRSSSRAGSSPGYLGIPAR